MKQHTVKKDIFLSGKGLHSGSSVNMRIRPAQEDVGITFVRTNILNKPAIRASISNVTSTIRGTNIGEFHTIEHLMAALYICNVTNAFIELDAPEPPAMDGSSIQFINAIEKAGVIAQKGDIGLIKPAAPVIVRNGDSCLIALPSDRFRITFMINYRFQFIGSQYISCDINKESFKKDIAPARTYGFVSELTALKAKGLGLGASTENAVAISETGYVNELRFQNELVRHKALDLVGDISLTGLEIKAHVIGIRSGHELNAALCRELIRR
jgi:UDP-3-O-[3-hydroxymyristoyl] N-acetylglucosamine deacetylase